MRQCAFYPARRSRSKRQVEYERTFGLFPNVKLGGKVAQFRQINMGKPNVHHDALEFPDGEIVLLTRLCEGQRARVLQLPATPRSVSAAHEQRRDSIVN
jgi:hypothetical protein